MNDNLAEKERRAIENLRAFEPQSEPYYLCYSGGKDSDCIRILAELAGVKHDIVHNLTTVDAPETVYYVRSIPNVIIEEPEKSMWQLIPDNLMPPTRLVRYCCEELKERGGLGRLKITGVRKAESRARAERSDLVNIVGKPKTTQKAAEEMGADYRVTDKGGLVMDMDNDPARRLVEHCYRSRSVMVNPIIDWTDNDVWEFLHHYGCSANPLYQCGKRRIGCIGCPMQGGKGMKADFAKYPIYRANYVKAFDRMIEEHKRLYLQRDTSWETGEEVMRWWVGDDPRQITLEDMQW
ncbi:MAG: phosphoadenosine phosphosulfate reductase family protein [Oscillospiraceae bacterium]|nr:phosphoadenosine phosphosulfate reductase family protein [Oscillospiraceae bacterium]